MSSALAIGAVSAVLRQLLDDALSKSELSFLGTCEVTALPPDVLLGAAIETPWLDLFLYQITPNSGWRNADLPSRGQSGERISNPPLALDLHYLLIASSSKQRYQAEILLGCGMQALHEVSCLSRDYITQVLPATSSDPLNKALALAKLAEQVEQIRICPQAMSTEEISKLWTVFGAKYRPSVAYLVSVVLIQSEKETRSPLPVLAIGKDDRGVTVLPNLIPPYPTIERIDLPNGQISALPGDALTIVGHHFTEGVDGQPLAINKMTVRLTHPRLLQPIDVDVPPANYSDAQVKVSLPLGTDQFPAGVYSVSLLMTLADPDPSVCTTNEVMLSVAPSIKTIAGQPLSFPPNLLSIPRSNLGDPARILLTCNPPVLPGQRVVLLLGARSLPADTSTQSSDSLTFTATGVTAGNYRLRLRVDGVDSLLINRRDERHPKFDDSQQVVVTE
jgi:hypothetical protein